MQQQKTDKSNIRFEVIRLLVYSIILDFNKKIHFLIVKKNGKECYNW